MKKKKVAKYLVTYGPRIGLHFLCRLFIFLSKTIKARQNTLTCGCAWQRMTKKRKHYLAVEDSQGNYNSSSIFHNKMENHWGDSNIVFSSWKICQLTTRRTEANGTITDIFKNYYDIIMENFTIESTSILMIQTDILKKQ